MDVETMRKELISRQAELSMGWVSFPLDAKCSRCGYDFLEHPNPNFIISGCPKCGRSFCEGQMIPRKCKAKVKVTASGKKVSYGQAGRAKDGGPRVRPGTKKGDSYCARSRGQMKRNPKAAKNPNSPLRLSTKRWKCRGSKSAG